MSNVNKQIYLRDKIHCFSRTLKIEDRYNIHIKTLIKLNIKDGYCMLDQYINYFNYIGKPLSNHEIIELTLWWESDE